MNIENRITYNPRQCGGKPCVRGMRIKVADILQMLGEGVSVEEILQDFPDLEQDDIRACLLYAARRANLERLGCVILILDVRAATAAVGKSYRMC